MTRSEQHTEAKASFLGLLLSHPALLSAPVLARLRAAVERDRQLPLVAEAMQERGGSNGQA